MTERQKGDGARLRAKFGGRRGPGGAECEPVEAEA
jgi:hypothetical protein